MMSLGSYLERKLVALKATRATASPNQKERRQHLTTSCIAEGGSGVRRIRIRDFQVITDTGPAMALKMAASLLDHGTGDGRL